MDTKAPPTISRRHCPALRASLSPGSTKTGAAPHSVASTASRFQASWNAIKGPGHSPEWCSGVESRAWLGAPPASTPQSGLSGLAGSSAWASSSSADSPSSGEAAEVRLSGRVSWGRWSGWAWAPGLSGKETSNSDPDQVASPETNPVELRRPTEPGQSPHWPPAPAPRVDGMGAPAYKCLDVAALPHRPASNWLRDSGPPSPQPRVPPRGAGHSPPRSWEPLLEQTSSSPEAETAEGVSSAEEGSPGQTLALLLSKRERPDTSRKPGGRHTILLVQNPDCWKASASGSLCPVSGESGLAWGNLSCLWSPSQP